MARRPGRPITIKVEGARELRRALRKGGGDVQDMRQVHREIARDLAATSRPLVPHGATGKLAASLKGEGTQTKARIVAGSASVPYAGPIHFGWPSRPQPSRGVRGGPIPPNPFLYTAIDRRRAEVMAAYQEHVERICAAVERAA
jgi:hypothetical protein